MLDGKTRGTIKPSLFAILMKIFYDLKLTIDKKVNYKKDALIKWANNAEEFNNFYNKQWQRLFKTIEHMFSILKTKLFITDLKYLPKEVYLLVIFSLIMFKRWYSKENDFRFDF